MEQTPAAQLAAVIRPEELNMTDSEWDRIIENLNSDDGKLFISALDALDEASDESRIPDLLSLIDHDDFVVRECAALPLARIEGVRALPQLFQALNRGQEEGYDNDGLVSLVSSLLETHKQDSAPLLFEMIRSEKSEDRENAAWAFGFLPADVALEPLLDIRNDASPEVRASVAGSLSGFGSNPRVFEVLVEMLEDDDEQVRVSTVASLGYLGDKQAIPVLQNVLNDPSERVRSFTQESLEHLGVKSKDNISDRIKQFVRNLFR